MKKLIYYGLLVVALNSYNNSQTDLIFINEGEMINICGKLLAIDGIWINEGVIRADISILEKQNSKPITGGFKRGDSLEILGTDNCKYYISSITKSGLDSSKGKVVLSNTPPPDYMKICEDTLVWKEGIKNRFDTLDHKLTLIRNRDDDKLTAIVEVSCKSAFMKDLELKKNDLLWAGECLYKVTAIATETGSGVGNNREIVPGHLVLSRQNYYIHSSIEEIKGLNNLPNIISKSYFVIRKAQLYKGMKPTKEELESKGPKLWLIQIFFKSRGIASRSMKVMLAGKMVTVEFEPVRTFNDEDEALVYAKENSITDIKLEEEK